MQRAFGGEDIHDAVRKFDMEVTAQGLSSMEVVIRWAAHHSALGDEDAIILGASKPAQLQESVSLIAKGPLPSPVLELTDDLWAAVQQTRGDVP